MLNNVFHSGYKLAKKLTCIHGYQFIIIMQGSSLNSFARDDDGDDDVTIRIK